MEVRRYGVRTQITGLRQQGKVLKGIACWFGKYTVPFTEAEADAVCDYLRTKDWVVDVWKEEGIAASRKHVLLKLYEEEDYPLEFKVYGRIEER